MNVFSWIGSPKPGLRFASRHVFGAMAALLSVSCSGTKYSLPPNLSQGESMRVAPKGNASVSASVDRLAWGGDGGNWDDNAFELGGTLGLGRALDLKGGISFSKPSNYPDSLVDRFLGWSMRLKWSPAPVSRYLALTAGGGVSFLWEHVAYTLEQGTIVGFDNPYLVPYANLRWNYTGNVLKSAESFPTWGSLVLAGVQIPLDWRSSHPSSIKLEAGKGNFHGERARFSYLYMGAQAQLAFHFAL